MDPDPIRPIFGFSMTERRSVGSAFEADRVTEGDAVAGIGLQAGGGMYNHHGGGAGIQFVDPEVVLDVVRHQLAAV